MQAEPESLDAARLADLAARLGNLAGFDDGARRLAERARARIERDLLPRLVGGRPELIVGVVGPNNAGKSSLVNALAGRAVTAVRATGGATRRLVGASSPASRRALLQASARGALGPFAPVPYDPERDGLELGLEPGGASELPVAEAPALPDGVLLVDSPDFDSAREGHRAASEALSVVSDVALVVVTKGSYLNAEVVNFLKYWLAGERPWVLVVNQSAGPEVARRQAAELTKRVGAQPLALYHAPLDVAVQGSGKALAPQPLEPANGPPLRALFSPGPARRDVAARAQRASFAGLRADLLALADALDGRAQGGAGLERVARAHAAAGAQRIATGLLPSAPLAAAFRTVLDRRGGALHRGVRGGARWIGKQVAAVPRILGFTRAPTPGTRLDVAALEAERLGAGWLGFFEPLARDLGSERRAPEAREAPQDLADRVAADLDRAPWTVRDQALAALAQLPLHLEDFEAACERLVEDEIERSGDWVIQQIATLSAVLPVLGAGAVIVVTGGAGADLAFAGVGAASYGLYDWWVERTGAGLMERARAAWEEPRAAALGHLLYAAALPLGGPILANLRDVGAATAAELRAFASEAFLQ